MYLKQKVKGFPISFRAEAQEKAQNEILESLRALQSKEMKDLVMPVKPDIFYDGTDKNSNTFSRHFLRSQLRTLFNLGKEHEGDKLKQTLKGCSAYFDLDEKFFEHSKALHFCQIGFLTQSFVEKSTIAEDGSFFCLVNAPA
jgi:hypothetical protein